MKLIDGHVRNGEWQEGRGDLVVSRETLNIFKKQPTVTLFLREQGKQITNGAVFVFSMPPQGFTYDRDLLSAVMQTRHGYSIGEGGLTPPTFQFTGHFGWRLRRATLPAGLFPIGPKRVVKYDNQLGDFKLRVPKVGLGEDGPESWVESLMQGRLSLLGIKQVLDGREAWQALNDLIEYYAEENATRVSKGKAPLEMVLHCPLEELRWVVVPRGGPSTNRTWQEQGKWPYTLKLIGKYDDSRPRPARPEDPWVLEPRVMPRTTAGVSPRADERVAHDD